MHYQEFCVRYDECASISEKHNSTNFYRSTPMYENIILNQVPRKLLITYKIEALNY